MEFCYYYNTYNKLIKYAAKRYEIRGILDKEDLYQEGLAALHISIEKYKDKPDFSKSFKSHLFYVMSNTRNMYFTKARESTVTNRLFSESSIIDSVSGEETTDILSRTIDLNKFKKELIDKLRNNKRKVAKYALDILNIITDDDFTIPDSVRQLYKRIPNRITDEIISNVTGYDINKVKKGIKFLREETMKLAKKYGYR